MRNYQFRITNYKWAAVCLCFIICNLSFVIPPQAAMAQDAAEMVPDEENDILKPTEIGIRFTPEIAGAISRKFVNEMKPRYGLTEMQTDEIQQTMQRQFMRFARNNSELGRDMIELMIATTLENDGMFPKAEAKQFGKMATQFSGKLKEFFTQSGAEIGQKMTVKQRLQFTGDVGLAAAGLMTFENRMKRWEEGKVGETASPFLDAPGDNEDAKSEPEPRDPNETDAHRKVRKRVEQWNKWSLDCDEQWPKYLDQAAKYYSFTDPQMTAGKAILKECRDRAKPIKTPSWRSSITELKIAQQLSYGAGQPVSEGPWIRSLDEAIKRSMQPMDDLENEFKRRIEGLPDSTQRALARENVRKALADKGVKQLPI